MARIIIAGRAEAPVLALTEGLSFWGGVDPASGRIVDAHHPQHGESLAGQIVAMPTSRGSCSGSGVLLELALNGHAPAALVFREAEDVLTLGALLAGRMFDCPLPVLRLEGPAYDTLCRTTTARIEDTRLVAGTWSLPLAPAALEGLELDAADRAMLDGGKGKALRFAMETICTMALGQGATGLVDVTRAHIDGCIYAGPANLRFAEAMRDMGARVRVPTTMNAISVDRANWETQGVPPGFGGPAARLADAYVAMGAQPIFTCAPYQLDDRPKRGEYIAWAESNAVIYANSVIGARSVKHPDFLDLCIAMTGRAPLSGVYLDAERAARRVIEVALPARYDDALWPLLGYLAGRLSPDRIPLLVGLEATAPGEDDLKALCAAFGTSSAAPMLHVAGHTPEAGRVAPDADRIRVGREELADVWWQFNAGDATVDLVAFGSPHFSAAECSRLADLLEGRKRHPETAVLATVGPGTLAAIRADGVLARLEAAGVRVVSDLCWCSITEPVFPPATRVLMTNSGKYAHYAPGLCGREVRFGSLSDCVGTALSGRAPAHPPAWLG
ncbi:cis-3-hydroxy-L-proline dehydratase [Oceanibacterium hippocampi]|uniref:2-methyl-cis-aconitate hydratase n=1 Tax=Oceanibacterium hippocampi TaxID=745714 RepID=A0A1Y5SH33_9PROT|nr:aconitase family protein [Oceanibacterium hippocampi]SLN39516.1 hypothetical protein OCH7691_01649 [Oceanibacterium hippocampi]